MESKTPIHLSEAGEEIVEDVMEEKKVVQTRRCQPLLPLGTSTLPTITKIVKDKSDDTDDTHAYEDNAHKVILRTFSYFLKIATATHIDQRWSIFSSRSIRKRV